LGALSVAVLLGALLVGLHAGGRRVPWAVGFVHGLAGALGLLALTWALWRGAAHGPFAWDAGVLLAVGLAIGVTFASLPAARRHAGGVLALHAVAAGLGWLLVLGLAFG
jgi:hypothetical protein